MLPPNSPVSRKFIARRRPSGFSLVEVVLAVGVISFAFVAILGLLPAGLHQFRQAMDTSISSQIAQRIIQDAQQSDFDVLTEILPPAKRDPNSIVPFTSMVYPAGGGSRAVRYFDEQGNEVVPKGTTASATELADIVYTVNTRIQPWPTLPGTTTPDTSATTVGKSLVTMTVQVAFNPGGRPFKLDGTTQLIDLTDPKMKTLSIKNYSAQIGRND